MSHDVGELPVGVILAKSWILVKTYQGLILNREN